MAVGNRRGGRRARFAVVGSGESNALLVDAFRARGLDARLCSAREACGLLELGDTALVRLDVLRTLDGVEPGLELVPELERSGVRVLNPAWALLGAHDKLLTAVALARADLPHPRTAHLLDPTRPLPLPPPVVLKPRFGSWGADVFRCRSEQEARECVRELAGRPWFRAQGALVQALVPTRPRDLRLVVADGRVVGAVERRARPGEWRTNVSLGGSRTPAEPTAEERELAVRASRAIGADVVGVDLLEGPNGPIVLELNGAVDFDDGYSLAGTNVYDELTRALGLVPAAAVA